VSEFHCIDAIRALGEESRLRLLKLLLRREGTVSELATELSLTTYNASKHLRILREAGLVDCEKRGQLRVYQIAGEFRNHLDKNDNVLDLGCCLFRFDELPV